MINQKRAPGFIGNKKYMSTARTKNKRKNKKRKSGALTVGKIILLTFLTLLFLLFLLIYIFLNFYKPLHQDFGGRIDLIQDVSPEGEPVPPEYAQDTMERAEDIYTFLILGLHDDGFLTDTIIYMMFDTANKKISILNIPRDTYVNTLGYKGKKINGVFNESGYKPAVNAGKSKNEASTEGVKAVARMIKYTFGVPVDRYILADLEGFRELVDAVDGVDMEVPIRMKYEDPEQNLYIDLEKGWQHLNGDKAEQLIRFRKGDDGYPDYPRADLDRIATQQKFMSALMKKMLKFDVGQIKKLFDVNKKYVSTNLNAMEVSWFAAQFIEGKSVKLENIRLNTIPGEEYIYDGWSCYSTYKAEVMEIINKYYNPYKEKIPANNFNIFEPSREYAGLADIDGVTMDKLVK